VHDGVGNVAKSTLIIFRFQLRLVPLTSRIHYSPIHPQQWAARCQNLDDFASASSIPILWNAPSLMVVIPVSDTTTSQPGASTNTPVKLVWMEYSWTHPPTKTHLFDQSYPPGYSSLSSGCHSPLINPWTFHDVSVSRLQTLQPCE